MAYADAQWVAPHAGAWIEICTGDWQGKAGAPSLPMRERGLKLYSRGRELYRRPVAPHAGACIEIYIAKKMDIGKAVAPHAGAWIEIITRGGDSSGAESLPMRERGLKSGGISLPCHGAPVAPHAGAWIEIVLDETFPPEVESRSPCGSVD